jgi:hypothetical protein
VTINIETMMLASKLVVLVAFLATAVATSDQKNLKQPAASLEARRQLFLQWMKRHGKEYSDAQVLQARMNIWMDNHGM